MVDDAPSLLIGDANGERLEIRALRRSHPDASDFWDANWIESDVLLHVGGFRARYRASLRSDEFRSFREQVQGLEEARRDAASFATMEGQLAFALTLDKRGRVGVEGSARDDAGSRNALAFAFEIDATYIPAILRSLNDLARKYPVVGGPDA